jgi:hypothetical protein
LLILGGHLPEIEMSHHDLLIRGAKPRAQTEFLFIARAGKLFEKPLLQKSGRRLLAQLIRHSAEYRVVRGPPTSETAAVRKYQESGSHRSSAA